MKKLSVKKLILLGLGSIGIITFSTKSVIAEENSVLPLAALPAFVLFISILAIGIIYYGYKQRWNITSFAIPIVLILTFAAVAVTAPIPIPGDGPEEFDYHILMNARISPWSYNITFMDGFDGSAPDCDFDHVIELMTEDPKDMTKSRDPSLSCNDIDDSIYHLYLEAEEGGGQGYEGVVVATLMELPVIEGKDFIILALSMVAFDTEHGFIFPRELNPDGEILDYEGSSIELVLPQRKPVTIYLQIPNIEGFTFIFRCSFFCGAGHFGMLGQIQVVP